MSIKGQSIECDYEAIMEPSSEPRSQVFPGGVENPMYRFAFRAWLIFFLLLICVGLLNYLGTVLR